MSNMKNNNIFLIETELGSMKIKLYDETPLHRDNFIKLVKEKYYNGSPWHRVIKDFMIQGGGATRLSDDIGYTLPAEIKPEFIHKKGALAAARQGDHVNPKKNSAGSQFYIVQGRPFTAQELTYTARQMRKEFTPEQVETYSTLGGTPHLDGEYTIFGEVIEGLEVIDLIADAKTNSQDSPVQPLSMKITPVI
jgi:cyclophilin family peptidyl-prolyl cis-trans isomerase